MKTYVRGYISSEKNAKKLKKDMRMRFLFMLAALLSSSAIAVIIIFISLKGISPFMPDYQYGQVNFLDFLFGTLWRKDQGVYGVGFIIINTLVSSFGALLISFPLSVLSALFIVKIAPKKVSAVMTTVVELLASIPSVVYGLLGILIVNPMMYKLELMIYHGSKTHQFTGGANLLSAIIVLAIMILPTLINISETALKAVPDDYRKSSLALGASKMQTIFKVVVPSAKSGIMSAIVLGVGRAIGEAMAILLVAGNAVSLPLPFNSVRFLTTAIVSEMGYASGTHRQVLFTIGLVLFIFIMVINLVLTYVLKRGDLDE